jgi:hypothetical protein
MEVREANSPARPTARGSAGSRVLVAAAACEMHPNAVIKGAGLASTAKALADANERALADGVTELPAIWTSGGVLSGDRAIPA